MNELDAIRETIATTEKTVLGMPKWRLALYAAIALFAAAYLIWCVVHKPAPAPGVFRVAPPAVNIAKVPGPILKAPLQVVPKRVVEKKFPAVGAVFAAEATPKDEAGVPEDEEVVDTAEIPASKNGMETVTFMNVSTGVATTTYTEKKAPWFAFEATNALGAQRQWSNQGNSSGIYYRRGIARVKDFHLVGTADANVLDTGKVNYHVGVGGEYQW